MALTQSFPQLLGVAEPHFSHINTLTRHAILHLQTTKISFTYFCRFKLFMAIASTYSKPEELLDEDVLVLTDKGYQLIVWNDEVNTFDWVIETLVEICGHNHEQAEQCALIIHLQGKYAVKQGEYEKLKPLCEAILDRGIGATIEADASV